MEWVTLDREKSRTIVNKVLTPEDGGLFNPVTSEVKVLNLPFYSDFQLYRITNYASLPSFSLEYLGNGDSFYRLDGSPDPIYMANKLNPIYLDINNVLLYLDFFLSNVRAEDGDIFLVTDPQNLAFYDGLPSDQQAEMTAKSIQPQVSYEYNLNAFVVNATLYFTGIMMNALVQVGEDGSVAVIDQTMLMSTDMPIIPEIPYSEDTRRY